MLLWENRGGIIGMPEKSCLRKEIVMVDAKCERFLTIGDIAEWLGVPIHRVKYAIERHRIEPVQRAGIIRLYRADQLPQVRLALRRVNERATANGETGGHRAQKPEKQR